MLDKLTRSAWLQLGLNNLDLNSRHHSNANKNTQLDPSRPHGRRGPPEIVGLERQHPRRRAAKPRRVKNVSLKNFGSNLGKIVSLCRSFDPESTFKNNHLRSGTGLKPAIQSQALTLKGNGQASSRDYLKSRGSTLCQRRA